MQCLKLDKFHRRIAKGRLNWLLRRPLAVREATGGTIRKICGWKKSSSLLMLHGVVFVSLVKVGTSGSGLPNRSAPVWAERNSIIQNRTGHGSGVRTKTPTDCYGNVFPRRKTLRIYLMGLSRCMSDAWTLDLVNVFTGNFLTKFSTLPRCAWFDYSPSKGREESRRGSGLRCHRDRIKVFTDTRYDKAQVGSCRTFSSPRSNLGFVNFPVILKGSSLWKHMMRWMDQSSWIREPLSKSATP